MNVLSMKLKMCLYRENHDFMLVFQKPIPEIIRSYKCPMNIGPALNSYGYLKFRNDFHVTELCY
jgi:hypothetical protein